MGGSDPCVNRLKYPTLAEAHDEAALMERNGVEWALAFPCRKCGSFHIDVIEASDPNAETVKQ